jgi:sulfite oxidase
MYGKHPDFLVRVEHPFNGGAPPALAVQNVITPNDLFFVRSHADVPQVDPLAYRLTIDGLVRQPLTLTLDDLHQFSRRTLVAALQCAGNRRVEMEQVAPIPDEIIWGIEAVSNAEWSGVSLGDVLRAAGVDERAGGLQVAFEGLDQNEKDGERFPFGGSIPVDKALRPEVLLADTMNGAPLPLAHGFPLRVVVPGYIGARSVKWVTRITVQAQPSDNYYQARAYKLFPSDVHKDSVDWAQGMMLGELPVNALIVQPEDGAVLRAGEIVVRGHALTGGRQVERVDLSCDGGTTWRQAAFLSDSTPWGWRLWEARLLLTPGQHLLMVRAWDSAAQTQPERVDTIWNFKGYMNNAVHRIQVNVTI